MSVIDIGGCPPTSLESKSLVPRHRLLSLLNEGTKYPLTLCVASSGWGKGTLLTSWANHTDKHVSWLQVDESDNEVAMFYQKLASSLLAMLSKQDYQSDPPPGASSLDLAWTLEQVSHITETTSSYSTTIISYPIPRCMRLLLPSFEGSPFIAPYYFERIYASVPLVFFFEPIASFSRFQP